MKKGLLLSALMVMMSLTANAYDAEINGIYYNFSGSKAIVTYRDSQYSSYSGSVTIPESVSYNGQTYSVTDINGWAFAYCFDLNSITIPNSVTSIGDFAFQYCRVLKSVAIPDGVTSIGYQTFGYCSALTSVTIPNSVTNIGERAFDGCISLQSATIPSGVTEIGERAFGSCESLTSATIPDGVTEIGLGTFFGCTSLTSLTIGNGVTSIGMSAFAGCRLTSLVFPNSVTSIGAFAFANCSDITSVTFPNSLKSIGSQAFEGCAKLTSLTIPNSVNSIAYDAFFGCSGLTSFVIDKGNAIYDSRDDCNAIIETGSNTLIWGCSNTIIPNSVTSIGNYAFQVCEGLTSVNIPEGITSIGEGAFDRCSNLKIVSIPRSVTYIGSCTFDGCFNLTDFYCYAENVPETEYDLFGDRPTSFFYHELPHESATLHVPAVSIEKYKATEPWKDFGNIVALENTVSYTKDLMATIILPTEPDASKGKYYRLDRCEKGKIIFEEELSPKARTPYIIVPKEDFCIDLNALDLDGLLRDTVSVKGASFIGSYSHEELSCQDGFYIDIIDATPDCQADDSNQRKAIVGALRACLIVNWDDPYNPGGSKGITGKRELVLNDNPNGIESLIPDPSPREKGTIYDLSGRKVNSQFSILNSQLKQKGLYIKDGKKILIK